MDAGGRHGEHATLVALVEHIEVVHHARARDDIARLGPMMDVVRGTALVRLAHTFDVIAGHLLVHMKKEEVLVFPVVRDLERGVRAPFARLAPLLAAMREEHEAMTELLAELRAFTAGYAGADEPTDVGAVLAGLRAFDSNLERHVQLEDELLFPRARAIDSAAQ